jgi:predicted nuclease with TOPRIM domain
MVENLQSKVTENERAIQSLTSAQAEVQELRNSLNNLKGDLAELNEKTSE